MKYSFQNLDELRAFAREVATSLQGGEVLALVGDLGAGKTTFTQMLCEELGVTSVVNSPTFVVMKEYEAHHKNISHITHMDAYRITNEEQIFELGLDAKINQQHSLVVIEWEDKIKKYLDRVEQVRWIEFER